MVRALLAVCTILACAVVIKSQFPAVCNNAESINTKTCCPNNCGGVVKGNCTNITAEVDETWSRSRPDVVQLIRDSPNLQGKGKADVRYKWPTMVFEKVCVCGGNYYGADCSECKFGYTGDDCRTKKRIIIRQTFSRLSIAERENVVLALSQLKNEYGKWSIVKDEPISYDTGSVTLQNVTTFDMIIFMHNLVGRDEKCKMGSQPTIDFAHEGPVFPMWHRHYLLFVEREMQRILGNESFPLPYWSWDTGEMEMFTEDLFGFPASSVDSFVTVTSSNFNSTVWPVVCDEGHRNRSVSCADSWAVCDPETDRNNSMGLQRGMRSSTHYIPTVHEIMIALTAPSYDTSDMNGDYGVGSPPSSFRNRLEGFARICSASNCIGYYKESHMHNVVHLWIGGHMSIVPSAVNDPIFTLHHCNIDRILESWIRRYVVSSSNPFLLPGYVPASGGHPGHNKVDYMVPFFPLVKPIDYYSISDDFGYEYEELIESDILDSSLGVCDLNDSCASCTFPNGTCINCADGMSDNCTETSTRQATSNILSPEQLLLILVLGIPLLVCLILLILLTIALSITCLKRRKS
eukprot:TRINITY_DN10182_c1_g1_i1.p1 TRINITY_DN10182_c1_g1~~TRINITY_DN10182_c1_g1_i1.p1  ORF type:complete len:575 (-),score=43.43 TRINITY_DN10182_c1_g1_i1:171-1895(-)